MKKVSFLVLALFALGSEGIFQGQTNTAARKSFGTSLRSLRRRSEALADQVLNRPLRGRARLDLISSLEDDAVTPPVNNNAVYNQIKELITSLEDDAAKIQGGDVMRKKQFRKNYQALGKSYVLLTSAMGVSNVGKRPKGSYQPDNKPTT